MLAELSWLMTNHVKATNLGEIHFAPFGVVLDRLDDVQPDLMFVYTARKEIIFRRDEFSTGNHFAQFYQDRPRKEV